MTIALLSALIFSAALFDKTSGTFFYSYQIRASFGDLGFIIFLNCIVGPRTAKTLNCDYNIQHWRV